MSSPARSVVVVGAASCLNITAAFFIQVTVAYHYGSSAALDAYLIALVIPAFLATVLVSAVDSFMVPLVIRTRTEKGEEASRRLMFSAILSICACVTLLTAAGLLFRRPLLHTFMHSLPGAVLDRAVRLSLVTWPVLALHALIGLFSSLLQAHERYAWQAYLPVLGQVLCLLAIVVGAPRFGITAYAAGYVGSLAMQVPLLAGAIRRHWPRQPQFSWEAVQAMWKLGWPFLLGGVFVRSVPLLERMAAAGFPSGSIANLNYAAKLSLAVTTVVTTGVGTVLLPSLSEVANSAEGFRRRLLRATLLMIFVVTPVVGIAYCLREQLVRVVLRHGALTAADASAVAKLAGWYLIYVFAASLGTVFGRALYALQKTRLAMTLNLLGIAFYAVLLAILPRHFGVVGIAMAMAGYFVVFTAIPGLILLRYFSVSHEQSNLAIPGKIALAGTSVIVFLYLATRGGLLGTLPLLMFAVTAALLLYVGVAFVLNVPQLWLCRDYLMSFVKTGQHAE